MTEVYTSLAFAVAGSLLTITAIVLGFRRLPRVSNVKSKGILKVRLLLMFCFLPVLAIMVKLQFDANMQWLMIIYGIAFFMQALIVLLAFAEADYLDGRWQVILENSPELMITLDRGIITFANRGFRDLSPAQLLGRTFMEFFSLQEQAVIIKACSASQLSKGVCSAEVRYQNPADKKTFYYSLLVRPLLNRGDTTDLVVSLADVTKQVEGAEQLARSEKMAALSRLATSVGHEFNNSLTVVLGYLDEIKNHISGPEILALTEQTQRSTSKAASLANQLATFGFRQLAQEDLVDVNVLINKSIPEFTRLLGPEIALSVENSIGHSVIKIDAGMLLQALTILAQRAKTVMSSGGRLVISVVNRYREPIFTGQHETPGGNYSVISVSDNGAGLTSQARELVFEPVFSAATGEPFNLGLSAVYNIVKRFRGEVSIASDLEHGTTVTLLFPLLAHRADAEIPTEATAGKAILLVEDEEPVRKMCAMILRRADYVVTEAANGQEAVDLVNRRTEPFDLLLTDVIMPIMNGKDAAALILKKWPDLPVIYMSGFIGDVVIDKGLNQKRLNFLAKPFSPAALLDKINETFAKVKSHHQI